jgi:hypothetical protein
MAESKPTTDSTESTSSDSPSSTTVDNPLVFISHDSRDAELAEAFANLLTDASGGILKSFRSSDKKGTAGIEFGSEWYRAIMEKIDDATDVVALLTPRSINRPWILYESGFAKGKLNSTVLGLAIGVPLDEAATGPFAQFQNSADDEDSLTKLVLQLIRRHPHASPREEAVRRQVGAFRDAIASAMQKIDDSEPDTVNKVDESSVAKLFEEVKILVRDVPDRVANEVGMGPSRRLGKRGFHPFMLEEIVERFGSRKRGGDALGLLIMASFVRHDAPWIYDVCNEYYRATISGNKRQMETARRSLHDVMKLSHSKFMFEMFESKGSMMAMDHIQMMIDRIGFRDEPKSTGDSE